MASESDTSPARATSRSRKRLRRDSLSDRSTSERNNTRDSSRSSSSSNSDHADSSDERVPVKMLIQGDNGNFISYILFIEKKFLSKNLFNYCSL